MEHPFSLLDAVIVVVYLLLIVGLGVFVNRYIHRLSDYLVAGRGVGVNLGVATLVGTELGLVTIMYSGLEGYRKGFAALSLALIGFGAALLVGLTGFVVKELRRQEILTIPEYYERRFGRSVRVLGGGICALSGILNMGLFPKMGAIFLAYSTGLAGVGGGGGDGGGDANTIKAVMSVLIALVLLYTVMGGMVAVIVTDYVQFVVLSIGLGLAVYFCLYHPLIGWEGMVKTLSRTRGEAAFNPFHADSYGAYYLVWMVLLSVAAMVCWAPGATRALAGNNEKTAARMFSLASLGYFARFALPYFLGVAAFCFIAASPELGAHFLPQGPGGALKHPLAAVPAMLGRIVPSGLLGLLVAGMMAAFMSTHDSYFMAWASVIAQDVYCPLRSGKVSPKQRIRVTRIAIIGIGAFLMLWGLWYPLPKSVWNYMAVTGTIYLSGAIAVLVGGIYWKRASQRGALIALLCGLVAVLGVIPGDQPGQMRFSFATVGLLSFGLSAAGMIAGSWFFPDPPRAPGAPGAAGAASQE